MKIEQIKAIFHKTVNSTIKDIEPAAINQSHITKLKAKLVEAKIPSTPIKELKFVEKQWRVQKENSRQKLICRKPR